MMECTIHSIEPIFLPQEFSYRSVPSAGMGRELPE